MDGKGRFRGPFFFSARSTNAAQCGNRSHEAHHAPTLAVIAGFARLPFTGWVLLRPRLRLCAQWHGRRCLRGNRDDHDRRIRWCWLLRQPCLQPGVWLLRIWARVLLWRHHGDLPRRLRATLLRRSLRPWSPAAGRLEQPAATAWGRLAWWPASRRRWTWASPRRRGLAWAAATARWVGLTWRRSRSASWPSESAARWLAR